MGQVDERFETETNRVRSVSCFQSLEIGLYNKMVQI
jgi:hypothetical protein